MRRAHPLWRGFFVACLWTAIALLAGGVDWLAALQGETAPLALAVMTALGAGIGGLPRLWKRGAAKSPRPGWARLVGCFLCGATMALACGMAGTGRILPALAEGSTGAAAFVGAAALAALLTGRLTARRWPA